MLHAIVQIAVKFGGLAALKDELDHFEAVTLVECAVVTLHGEVAEDQARSLLYERLVKALEVELVQVRLADEQAHSAIVVLVGQVSDEHGKLLSESGWKRGGTDGDVLDDAKHVLETGRLSIELSLSVSLAGDLDPVALAFGGLLGVDKSHALRGAQNRDFL